MRVLVTGGAGFIGSNLVPVLLERGDEVHIWDPLISPNSRIPDCRAVLHNGECSYLSHSSECKNLRFDSVVHLAAVASVQKNEDPDLSLRSGEGALLSVLDYVYRTQPDLRSFVYASSAAVYPNSICGVSEEDADPGSLSSNYAVSKYSGELYLRKYTLSMKKFYGTSLRFFNVYGRFQNPNSSYSGVISKFLSCWKDGRPAKIYGSGHPCRDFIHVSDVCTAICFMMDRDSWGSGYDVFNVGTGMPTHISKLWEIISEGAPAEIFSEYPSNSIFHSYANILKLRKMIPIFPMVSLKDGIDQLKEHYA